MWKNIKSAFSIWNVLRGTRSNDLDRQVSMPISLVVIGDETMFEGLVNRLGARAKVSRSEPGGEIADGDGQILLDARKLLSISESDFEDTLGKIAIRHAERRIALAAAFPAFRSQVVNQISHEWALKNAKLAAISALPGIIPLTDWLMPVTSAGDLYLLTKNQILLLLEVAACYGRPANPSARIKELLPVVGGAFGWRAVARELIGLVPGGVGVAVKSAVAYAGTYTVGRAAAYFYAGNGRKMNDLQMGNVLKGAITEAVRRGKAMLSR